MKKILLFCLLVSFSFGADVKLKACDSAAVNYGVAQENVVRAFQEKDGFNEARLRLADAYANAMKYCIQYDDYTSIIISTHEEFTKLVDGLNSL